MKTLFTFLALALSISAFAVENQHITCNFNISGTNLVEMQYYFPTPTSVVGHVVIDDVKIPTPTNEVETTEDSRIVTNTVGQPDVQTISVEFPLSVFTNEEDMFFSALAKADDKYVWAACINF